MRRHRSRDERHHARAGRLAHGRRRWVWCAALFTTGVSSCAALSKSQATHTGRAVSVVPAIPPEPVARFARGVCATRSTDSNASGGSANHPVIAVSRNPVSAVVYWLPGLNARPCQVAASTLTSGQARKLASSINGSQPMKSGAYDYPNSDGSAAEVYFRFADGTVEFAYADLNGCETVGAPGRSEVGVNAIPVDMLLNLAPSVWRADNPMLSGKS